MIDKKQIFQPGDIVLVETTHMVRAEGSPHVSYDTMSWSAAHDILVKNALTYATSPDLKPQLRIFKLVPVEVRVDVIVDVDSE